VPGDVNSTLAAALAAVKLHIPVCHLEAGLRSFDWEMPEEHNRRLTDHVSSLLLTHSAVANDNLAREGIPEHRISFVGNTMIDSLLSTVDRARSLGAWRRYGLRCREYLLVTLHRPALVDDPGLLLETMAALERVARHLPVIFPVHPRTLERLTNLGFVASERLTVTTPLPYRRFVSLEVGAAAVLTDSGGVQEETTALGVPCFTLRENTERPVTVTHGTNTVLGLEPTRIDEVPALLDEIVPAGPPPLWDGHAGARAAFAVESYLEVAVQRVPTRALTQPLAIRARPTLQ
jgi:UDP-N-acetylglucosamine 2-epimerase (non-hydrolysing)